MIYKLFLDANIFVAATKSKNGGSKLILSLGEFNKLNLVTVKHALFEAKRNIENKLGQQYIISYHEILLKSNVSIQSISQVTIKEIDFLATILPMKDVPILLGSIYSKCNFLITLDKKDLLENAKLGQIYLPFKILTPGDFIQNYLS